MSKLKKYLPYLMLTVLIFIASFKILPTSGVISYNDNSYFYNAEINPQNIFTTINTNNLEFDQSNILFNYFYRGMATFLFQLMGFEDSLISYFLSFGVLLLCSFSYYYVFSKISSNLSVGLFSALFILMNNLTLEYIAFGGSFFYSLSLMGLAFGIFYFDRCYKNKLILRSDVIYLSLFSLLIIQPFFFVLYNLFILFLFIYFSFTYRSYNDVFKKAIFFLTLVLMLNLFWIGPFLNSLNSNIIEETYSDNVDNVFNGYKSTSSYIQKMSLQHFHNSYSKNYYNSAFNILFYLFLLLVILFVVYTTKNNFLYFLAFLIVLFYNLAMGPNSFFTGYLFDWLWSNFSFFHFFRSFPRFLFLVPPLVIYFLSKVRFKNSNYFFYFLISFLLISHILFFTGDFQGSINTIDVPEGYDLVDDILKLSNESVGVISFPSQPYEQYNWSINKNINLIPQSGFYKSFLFSKPITYDLEAYDFFSKMPQFNFFKDFSFNCELAVENIDSFNFKFILLNKDQILVSSNLMPEKNMEVDIYQNCFRNNYLLVYSDDELELFINDNFNTILNSDDDILFRKYSNYRYVVNSENDLSSIYLNNKFNPNWIIINNSVILDDCAELVGVNNVVECISNSYVNFPNFFNVVNVQFNKTEGNLMKVDLTGLNIKNFDLFYFPQLVFIFSLIISTITFFIVLFYVWWLHE